MALLRPGEGELGRLSDQHGIPVYQTINRYEPFGPLWNPAWLEADRDKIEQKRRESVESLTERLYDRKPKIQY